MGIQIAEEQALHAASIALKSQFSLYWQAYGKKHEFVKSLYNQVLVFSIAHNNDIVYISAHFAVPKEGSDELHFVGKRIAIWSLTLNEGRDRDKAYSFVEKLHQEFSPKYLDRIRTAARLLPDVVPRTTFSFADSDKCLAPKDPNEQLSVLQAMLDDQKQEAKRREAELLDLLKKQTAVTTLHNRSCCDQSLYY